MCSLYVVISNECNNFQYVGTCCNLEGCVLPSAEKSHCSRPKVKGLDPCPYKEVWQHLVRKCIRVITMCTRMFFAINWRTSSLFHSPWNTKHVSFFLLVVNRLLVALWCRFEFPVPSALFNTITLLDVNGKENWRWAHMFYTLNAFQDKWDNREGK